MDEDKKEKRAEKKRALNENLRLELETVRESLADMLGQFKMKVDAQLVNVITAAGAGALPPSVAESMLKELRALRIKPEKGRAKDFERIEELLEDLQERLPANELNPESNNGAI